jgi:hypothetical protein
VDIFLAVLVVAGGFAAVLCAVVWFGSRIRRLGIGGGLMGPLDEIYNPAAHRSRQDVQVQEQRQAPNPSADDRWRGGTGEARWSGRPDPARGR